MARGPGIVALAVVWSAVGACGGESSPSTTGGSSGCEATSQHHGTSGAPAVDGAAGTPASGGTGGSTDAGVDVDAATGGTGANPTCLPEFVHGPLMSEDPANGIHVYESCDGKNVIILLDGSNPVSTMDQVNAFYQSILEAAFAIPGVVGMRSGNCCRGSLDGAACSHLDLDKRGTPLDALPAKLAAIVEDDVCVAFVVEQTGVEGPWCEPGAPSCTPQPYCSEQLGGCCPKGVSYDPCGPRTPVRTPVTESANLSRGACTHDGECYQTGNGCIAYTEPFGRLDDLVCRTYLFDALCGCVNDSCQWFIQ